MRDKVNESVGEFGGLERWMRNAKLKYFIVVKSFQGLMIYFYFIVIIKHITMS